MIVFNSNILFFKKKLKEYGEMLEDAADSAIRTFCRLYNYDDIHVFTTDVTILDNSRTETAIYILGDDFEKLMIYSDINYIEKRNLTSKSGWVATFLLEQMIKSKDTIDKFLNEHKKEEPEEPDYKAMYYSEKKVCHALQKQLCDINTPKEIKRSQQAARAFVRSLDSTFTLNDILSDNFPYMALESLRNTGMTFTAATDVIETYKAEVSQPNYYLHKLSVLEKLDKLIAEDFEGEEDGQT